MQTLLMLPTDSLARLESLGTLRKIDKASDEVAASDVRAVQPAIAAGHWRENPQAKQWAGHAVAAVHEVGRRDGQGQNRRLVENLDREAERSSSSRAKTSSAKSVVSSKSGQWPSDCLFRVSAGPRSRKKAKEWAGHAVAAAMKLDVETHKAKIVTLLKTLIGNGALVVVEGEDDRREKRKFVRVGTRGR